MPRQTDDCRVIERSQRQRLQHAACAQIGEHCIERALCCATGDHQRQIRSVQRTRQPGDGFYREWIGLIQVFQRHDNRLSTCQRMDGAWQGL